jgi:hypothetical protein
LGDLAARADHRAIVLDLAPQHLGSAERGAGLKQHLVRYGCGLARNANFFGAQYQDKLLGLALTLPR